MGRGIDSSVLESFFCRLRVRPALKHQRDWSLRPGMPLTGHLSYQHELIPTDRTLTFGNAFVVADHLQSHLGIDGRKLPRMKTGVSILLVVDQTSHSTFEFDPNDKYRSRRGDGALPGIDRARIYRVGTTGKGLSAR